jgi:hypothetical protein
VTEPSTEPLSLERARLLLGWLRAQRAVDSCLSELLAAGPAGERRVSGQIEKVGALVQSAAEAFDAYRTSVKQSREATVSLPDRPPLTSVPSLQRR